MKTIREENSGSCSKDIREPIKGIVSRSSWCKSLVVFIKDADDAENDERQKKSEPHRSLAAIFQKYPGCKNDSTTEEVAKMHDFIEMGDFRAALWHGLG